MCITLINTQLFSYLQFKNIFFYVRSRYSKTFLFYDWIQLSTAFLTSFQFSSFLLHIFSFTNREVARGATSLIDLFIAIVDVSTLILWAQTIMSWNWGRLRFATCCILPLIPHWVKANPPSTRWIYRSGNVENFSHFCPRVWLKEMTMWPKDMLTHLLRI